MSQRPHVLVIGAGMGGATAAIALQQAGCRVSLFEQAPQLNEIGAGVTIDESGTRALEYLGVAETLRARADIPPTGRAAGGARHYATDEPLGGETIDRPPGKTWFHQIHRADFQKMLVDEVLSADPEALHLGCAFQGFEQDDKGVTARFTNGQSARGDLLIGADGVRSAVRAALFGAETPRFTGQVAYRCLIPTEQVLPYLDGRWTSVYVGPRRTFVRYAIRGRSLINCAAFVKTDSWQEEGWSIPASPEELDEHFHDWHENIRGLIRNAPRDSLFKWALFDRDPIEQWTVGRVTLLGDAAHPMLPFLGMGAGMAIEDAIVLGRAIKGAEDLPDALRRYEAARKTRANKVLLSSRAQGERFQHDDPLNLPRREPPITPAELHRYDAGMVPV